MKDEVEDGDLLVRYLVHALNSPQYLARVDAMSTGSTKTSRNRFLQRMFLDMTIAVPADRATLATVVELLDEAARVKKGLERLADGAKGVRDAIGSLLP